MVNPDLVEDHDPCLTWKNDRTDLKKIVPGEWPAQYDKVSRQIAMNITSHRGEQMIDDIDKQSWTLTFIETTTEFTTQHKNMMFRRTFVNFR
jgi:hypothetical protein